MKMRSMLIGGAAVLAASAVAFAAGYFPGFPIVGGPAYCTSFNMNPLTGATTTTCNGPQTPAGPAVTTGVELFVADTQLAGGQAPQTVMVPSPLIGSINAKSNRLIGGDFGTNLWQRGTTPVSAATPSTTVIGADRWAVYSSGNTVTVTKQTGAADTIPASGFYASMRVSRPSGTNNTAICVGQVLDKQAAAVLVGANGVLSFYALAGAGFSAVNASNNLSVTIAYYTAADSATPLTNTDSFMKGTTTGYAAVVGGGSNGTTATVAAGVASVPISTTWARYAVYGAIPTANAAGTAVTGVGVTICYTPASGTGGSTEWFELIGVQLQVMPSLASATMPAGVTGYTGFDRRPQSLETALQLSYSYVITDGAITRVFGSCQEKVANTSANCYIQFPQQMRGVPTTVVSAAGWSIQQTDATNELCSALAGIASSNTVLNAGLLCTAPGTIALGVFSPFLGGATTSLMTFSAEP